jgi:pimeloyl-ACP methyl ester carboxylesterase
LKGLWVIVAVLFLSLGNTSIGLAQWAGVELPAVTGPYGVGTVVLPMVDSGRPGVYADGSSSEHREFMTQIWYPANRGVDGLRSTYMDEATAEYQLKGTNIPGVDKNIRFQIKTHGILGAQVAAGHERFPVLIFSPGLGMNYFVYQSILEELASHGYIVVGVNSPNIAGITVFPDGHCYHMVLPTDEKEEEEYEASHLQEVADDLQFVVKQLPLIDSDSGLPLAGRINFGRVGSFGHSYGGAAAVQASIRNSQLVAAANLDGSLWGEDYKKAISKPMMMVWTEHGDKTMRTIWTNLPRRSYQVQVKGMDHMSFSDLMLITKAMGQSLATNPNPIDPFRGIQISRDTLRTFFDVNFKNTNPKQMNKISTNYQEVKVEEK